MYLMCEWCVCEKLHYYVIDRTYGGVGKYTKILMGIHLQQHRYLRKIVIYWFILWSRQAETSSELEQKYELSYGQHIVMYVLHALVFFLGFLFPCSDAQ